MIIRKLLNQLKRYFVSGVLVVVPLILTYIVLRFMFESIDGILQPVIQKALGYHIMGLGVFVTILLILLAGVFSRNIIGAKLYHYGDKIITRMPIIRPIYSSAKQLIEGLTKPSLGSFKEVVLIEYPRNGVYAMAFISNHIQIDNDGQICDYYTLFVPSTPTPISGMAIIVPVDDVIHIEMSIEDGVKFLVSGGVASPETLLKKQKKATNETDKEV